MTIKSINPTTEETLRTFDELTDEELERRIALSERSFRDWRRRPYSDRAKLLDAAARVIDSRLEHWATLMTEEMGKPITAARAEARKCALACRYYAEHGEEILSDRLVKTEATRSWVRYDPLGPVLAVMPWNFPFWQVFRFVAPGLMAGNVGLLKHASSVPQCALAIEEILLEAGFPEGVFQTLLIGARKVPRILEDPRVRAATLTGSEDAGRDIARRAGAELKKVVLELGGSDPFIVMPSADLDDAVETGVRARIINNGQSCIAAKRFILHEEIAEEFEQRFVQALERLRVGDPMEEETELGPLANDSIRQDLERQVRESVAAGATVLTGGERLDRKGWFYAPTAVATIPEGAPAYDEELFGPVASLFRVSSLDEAIQRANDTEFGLGASAWTSDETEQRRFIEEIDSGLVFINAMVASTPELPFGGVKNSGYGRELGVHGAQEFVNIKSVWVQ
jgi:succinate-semialdehyde dehydrogenase / glutarate-semialdehyde dehydrogenase